MSDTTPTIAFLGAGGTMGRGMAANLARAGLDVRGWNRSREKAEPLADLGATICDTAAQAAEGADIIVTMLTDGDAVLATAPDALAAAPAGARWLQMSTIGVEAAERCAALAAERGVKFYDAPVLGTKQPAEAGELVVLASGPQDGRDVVAPVFDAVGKRTIWAGDAGMGSRLKLVTNAWLVAVVEGAAESIALAQGMQVDPALFLDAISGGPLDLPYLELKSKAMLEHDFTPSFRLALAAKDARLARAAATDAGLDLPMLEAVSTRFDEAAAEHGDDDLSAVFLSVTPQPS